MKIPDDTCRRMRLVTISLFAALPMTGCLFKKDNDHILFVEYNKVGVSTSGVSSAAYEPVLNVGWTGAKLAIVPASVNDKSRTPSLLANFEGSVGEGQVALGNTFATGSAADKIADKFTIINVDVKGDAAAVKGVTESQTGIAKANADAAKSSADAEKSKANAEEIKKTTLEKDNADELAKLKSQKETAEAGERTAVEERKKAEAESAGRIALLGQQFVQVNRETADSQKKISEALKDASTTGKDATQALAKVAEALSNANKAK